MSRRWETAVLLHGREADTISFVKDRCKDVELRAYLTEHTFTNPGLSSVREDVGNVDLKLRRFCHHGSQLQGSRNFTAHPMGGCYIRAWGQVLIFLD